MARKNKSFKVSLGVMLLSAGLMGCSNDNVQDDSGNKKDEKLDIVTTFYPMYDFTRNVAGEHSNVSALVQAGVEPHEFEPTAKDIAKIEDADIFVYNGNEMETWVPSVLNSIDTDKVTVVDASKDISLDASPVNDFEIEGGEEEEEESALDPHVWLNPVLAQEEVNAIEQGLVSVDKNNKSDYQENAAVYKDKLSDLDLEFHNALDNASNKEFVTQHAAFGYLAKEYGLTQIAIAGLSPEEEPSPAKLGQLQDYIEDNDIGVIYFEEVASPKTAQTLADATGAKAEILSPIEGITKEEQDKGVDYIQTMKNNLDALKQVIK